MIPTTRRRLLIGLSMTALPAVIMSSNALAQSPATVTPGPGSVLRRTLLNALRPVIIADLGAPIEFVVDGIRVAGNRAFVQVNAQRPGGRSIDLAQTPMARRVDPSLIDGTRIEAFMVRRNGRWSVDEHAVGSTDVWFSDPRFCTHYSAVLPTGICR
ncbi:MAG: hypothetical protein MUF14_02905 [Hyphomonadaceae bacterium]|jgi:hypothetical protein|nr:hypothetical protein [Hyphomonadaceae bacterium]